MTWDQKPQRHRDTEKNRNSFSFLCVSVSLWLILFLASSLSAQSTDRNFPSPITSNEINGTIKARDIGDSRLTSYYYVFEGGQGDIFINVVTKNFSGDIDIFAADDLRPLTKMVIYADSSQQETGRLIYLRKNERMILRVEGRSPNDDAAAFRIKFGGSFIALAPEKTVAEPTVAESKVPNESGIVVNSVGTIVAVIPKPTPTPEPIATPTPKPPVTIAKAKPKSDREASAGGRPGAKSKTRVAKTTPPAEKPTPKPESNDPKPKTEDQTPTTVFENETAKVVVEEPKPEPPKPKAKAEDPKPDPANPLASVFLVIELKDGNTIRRAMSEVERFNIENGTLNVRDRNGKVVRYRILEVAKVTIE